MAAIAETLTPMAVVSCVVVTAGLMIDDGVSHVVRNSLFLNARSFGDDRRGSVVKKVKAQPGSLLSNLPEIE